MIRDFRSADTSQICTIYNHYIVHTHHTFETEKISDDEMLTRISAIQSSYPYLVYEEDGIIMAYAFATRWKLRQAYEHTAESSIYLDPNYKGKGIGTKLYSHLIHELKQSDLHSILAGISLPNDASITLHEKLGFKKSGVLKEVGYKFGEWIDVGYWNLLI